MAGRVERWPPVYDLDGLLAEIKRLTEHHDIATAFYEWRRDRSTNEPYDVCQGDVILLASDVPVILDDGQPATVEHPDRHWLVIGNTCDFERSLDETRWTQLVPVISLGAEADLTPTQLAAARRRPQVHSVSILLRSAVERERAKARSRRGPSAARRGRQACPSGVRCEGNRTSSREPCRVDPPQRMLGALPCSGRRPLRLTAAQGPKSHQRLPSGFSTRK
jgi:hypothetical protein